MKDKTEVQQSRAASHPVVFLCHASEDKALVNRLAEDLMGRGIDVFFDKWEIRSGDSIRRKIDAGLHNCTHFIAVLTPQSIDKEWVNTEIDAAFVLKVEGQCKFIPLRVGLPVERLTPLLRSLRSPSLDDYERDFEQLISDILGISLKPSLGPVPAVIATRTRGLGISPAAEALVKIMIERSEHGYTGDPMLESDDVRRETGLTDDDIIDAVEELEGRGFVKLLRSLGTGAIGFEVLVAQSKLFATFDSYFKPWSPEKDALRIAVDLVNGNEDCISISSLAKNYDWPPRRINPALGYLINRNLVRAAKTINHPWAAYCIERIPATRRFVRDRG
ncbi:MAG: toll/interleukin-1 receptor domain-containing protein [Syntrophobacteraceae bacterium]